MLKWYNGPLMAIQQSTGDSYTVPLVTIQWSIHDSYSGLMVTIQWSICDCYNGLMVTIRWSISDSYSGYWWLLQWSTNPIITCYTIINLVGCALLSYLVCCNWFTINWRGTYFRTTWTKSRRTGWLCLHCKVTLNNNLIYTSDEMCVPCV